MIFNKMKLLLFYYSLLLMWTTVKKVSGSCGVRQDMSYDSTMNDVSFGEFPWQVSVKVTASHVCSGTIISEFWVLSSAECFSEIKHNELVMEVGVIHLDVAGRVYPVGKLVLHADYNNDTSDNNIALLESSEAITYNHMVQPACFPDDHLLNIDSLVNCWVTTWRKEKQDGSNNSETVLKKLPFIPTQTCQSNINNIMCAYMSDVEQNSDCTVKSGDAIMCQYTENKAWIVAGIVSNTSSECNKTVIFTRTASYIAWMKDNTRAEGKPVIPEINPGESNEEFPKKEEVTNFTVYHVAEIPPLEFGESIPLTNQTTSKDTLTNQTTSKDTLTNQTTSKDTLTNQTTSKDTITNQITSKDNILKAENMITFLFCFIALYVL